MLRTSLFVTAAIFLAAACSETSNTLIDDETRANAEHVQQIALKGSGAWEILESLTTEVGPRLAGSEGDRRAVKWAAAKFHELGFDRVWMEPVYLPGWRRISAEAHVLAPFDQPLVITSLGLSTSTPEGGIEADVIHFETLEDLEASMGAEVAGKIVFISNRMERTRDGSGYGPAVRARAEGASEAARRGAVALVIRSIGTDNKRLPHTGAMRYAEDIERIPAAALSNPDADMLVNQFRRGKPVRMFLNVQNEELGEVETFNVIGEVTGRSNPDQVVIMGGHLDSWDLGTGAIDDGAGVAISMAAGHIIASLEERPMRSIRVIAFGAEETGLWGGRAYAEAHAGDLANHIIGAESDFGSGRIYMISPGVSEAALPVMTAMAELMRPLGIEMGENNGGGGPDLTALREAGMPVASLKQDGTTYFDLHHTADDTLDKVDARDLDQNVAAYVTFAYLAAELETRFDDPEAREPRNDQ